jgi:hypothetical protein
VFLCSFSLRIFPTIMVSRKLVQFVALTLLGSAPWSPVAVPGVCASSFLEGEVSPAPNEDTSLPNPAGIRSKNLQKVLRARSETGGEYSPTVIKFFCQEFGPLLPQGVQCDLPSPGHHLRMRIRDFFVNAVSYEIYSSHIDTSDRVKFGINQLGPIFFKLMNTMGQFVAVSKSNLEPAQLKTGFDLIMEDITYGLLHTEHVLSLEFGLESEWTGRVKVRSRDYRLMWEALVDLSRTSALDGGNAPVLEYMRAQVKKERETIEKFLHKDEGPSLFVQIRRLFDNKTYIQKRKPHGIFAKSPSDIYAERTRRYIDDRTLNFFSDLIKKSEVKGSWLSGFGGCFGGLLK